VPREILEKYKDLPGFVYYYAARDGVKI